MNTVEAKALQTAIDLIVLSIRTAPKCGGIDDIVTFIVRDEQKREIVKQMKLIGERAARAQKNKSVAAAMRTSWVSDAQALERSQGLVMVGVRGKKVFNFNCSMCGFKSCAVFCAQVAVNQKKNPKIAGPFCVLKIWDIGIAIASAAKTASMLNVDNRIMYRIGVAALKTPLFRKRCLSGNFSKHVNPLLGLPLSVSGKNIYFDRLDKMQAADTLKSFYQKRR